MVEAACAACALRSRAAAPCARLRASGPRAAVSRFARRGVRGSRARERRSSACRARLGDAAAQRRRERLRCRRPSPRPASSAASSRSTSRHSASRRASARVSSRSACSSAARRALRSASRLRLGESRRLGVGERRLRRRRAAPRLRIARLGRSRRLRRVLRLPPSSRSSARRGVLDQRRLAREVARRAAARRRSSSAARSRARFSSASSWSRAMDQPLQGRGGLRLLLAQRRQGWAATACAARGFGLLAACARRPALQVGLAACRSASATPARASRQRRWQQQRLGAADLGGETACSAPAWRAWRFRLSICAVELLQHVLERARDCPRRP